MPAPVLGQQRRRPLQSGDYPIELLMIIMGARDPVGKRGCFGTEHAQA